MRVLRLCALTLVTKTGRGCRRLLPDGREKYYNILLHCYDYYNMEWTHRHRRLFTRLHRATYDALRCIYYTSMCAADDRSDDSIFRLRYNILLNIIMWHSIVGRRVCIISLCVLSSNRLSVSHRRDPRNATLLCGIPYYYCCYSDGTRIYACRPDLLPIIL